MSYVSSMLNQMGRFPQFSMVCFGAVVFDDLARQDLLRPTRPISDRFVPEAIGL